MTDVAIRKENPGSLVNDIEFLNKVILMSFISNTSFSMAELKLVFYVINLFPSFAIIGMPDESAMGYS